VFWSMSKLERFLNHSLWSISEDVEIVKMQNWSKERFCKDLYKQKKESIMIYIYLYLLLTAFIISIGDCAGPGPDITKEDTLLEPFAVSYEKIADLAGAANEYKLLIVEPEHYSKAEVDSLNTASNTLLAYVTLGEVDRSRWYYPLLEARGFLGVNENWDSPYLNLADSVTRSIMLDRVIPNIMIKGYDGLILDTVDDVAPYTDRAWLQPHMVDI